jgi:hypothetical protein
VHPSKLECPGIGVLPYILLPLAGPEELDLEVVSVASFTPLTYYHMTQDQERLPPALQFLPPTKKREPDSVLRLTHVETLLLLCTTRWGREFLRHNGVYEIVRTAHEAEKVDKARHSVLLL